MPFFLGIVFIKPIIFDTDSHGMQKPDANRMSSIQLKNKVLHYVLGHLLLVIVNVFISHQLVFIGPNVCFTK